MKLVSPIFDYLTAEKESKIYNILLLAALIISALLLLRFVTIGNKVVSEVDEVPYYNSSKVFAHQFSLKSTQLVEEEVSKITESDWYGPGYPIIYGSLRILMADFDESFIIANFFFICIVLVIISNFGIAETDRKWLYLVVLLCPSFVNYAFMFMPAVLDLALACGLMYLLLRIGNIYPEGRVTKLGILFLIAVLIAGLIKQNFLFFSFGLLFFSKNWKWFLIWLLGAAVLFVSVLIYNSLFLAPVYLDNLKNSISYLSNYQIAEFIAALGTNILPNLKEFRPNLVYLVPYYLVLLPGLLVVLNLKLKNRMIFAISAISGITFLTYFIFYTTNWVYFIRLSVPLVFINCVSVIFLSNSAKRMLKYSILVLFIFSLPFTVKEVLKNQDIKKRNYEYINYQMPDFTHITSYIEGNKLNTILLDPDFYKIYGFEQFLVAIPVENRKNIVRYTLNYRIRNKFQLMHKLKVDYVLTPNHADIPNTTLINKTDYYYLYKFTDQ